MAKKKEVDIFFNSVEDLGFKPLRCTDYHVQVQGEHNFYPTKNKYHNSDTMKTRYYNNCILTDNNEFSKFLKDNSNEKK